MSVKIHCFFITYLAQQNLSYPTIQLYLSIVRYNHRQIIAPNDTKIVNGIRKLSAITYQPREWLPITFPIMAHLHAVFQSTLATSTTTEML